MLMGSFTVAGAVQVVHVRCRYQRCSLGINDVNNALVSNGIWFSVKTLSLYVALASIPFCFRLKAGCKSLPPLLAIKQVMHQKTLTSVWSSKDELPVSKFRWFFFQMMIDPSFN